MCSSSRSASSGRSDKACRGSAAQCGLGCRGRYAAQRPLAETTRFAGADPACTPTIQCGALTYDQNGRVAQIDGQKLDLSAREIGLLEVLLTRMGRLVSKDSFRVRSDEESGQTIISGMGELHLDIIVDRMRREFNVEASVGAPQVATSPPLIATCCALEARSFAVRALSALCLTVLVNSSILDLASCDCSSVSASNCLWSSRC